MKLTPKNAMKTNEQKCNVLSFFTLKTETVNKIHLQRCHKSCIHVNSCFEINVWDEKNDTKKQAVFS